MRFAVIGDHADGWRLAQALRDSGRHDVVACAACDSPPWPHIRNVADPEELLADPQIEAVIVASPLGKRIDHLRRVLQSERSAFCVHPVDSRPDGGHEIHMLQGDVHQVVLPILPDAVAPSMDRGPNDVLDLESGSTGTALFEPGQSDGRPIFPHWTLLRRLGGEIVEIAVLASKEDIEAGEPAIGFGKFQDGRLFQATWLSNQKRPQISLTVRGSNDPPTLVADEPAAWSALVQRFESAMGRLKSAPRVAPGSGPAVDLRDGLGWQDEIRALELNDLARRSIERRRAYSLDFQEATEEVGFKGTMTLVGCALLWLAPVILIASAWVPWLGWLIVPVLVAFLAMQFLKGKGGQ
jgi:hypothetical protein